MDLTCEQPCIITRAHGTHTHTHSAASPTSDRPHRLEQDVEQARPNDQGEEDMQLKLALQLSKQQAEEEERIK